MTQADRLQGKTVIVTGSTTGIGEAIVRASFAQGANVVIHGRDAERGERLRQELGDTGRTLFVRDNLAEVTAADRIVKATVAAFGRIDAVVNNAAWVVRADLEATTPELFDGVMAVNVRAPFLMIQAALPHLEATRGCVANIGSVNSFGGERNLFPYSVSKGALLTLSKNLADALGPRQVRVFHFNVGWVLTDNEYHYKIQDGLPADWPQKLGRWEIPSGQMTTPAQIASVVTFWISDETRPFAGTVMELEQYPFEGRNPTRTG